MFKNIQLALGLMLTLLVAVPPASADEMANLRARIAKLERQGSTAGAMGGGNMVYFRGGYARNDSDRYGHILPDTGGIAGQRNGKQDGWYIGAGLDLVLSDDLFGFAESIELLGEIMFEYKEFDSANLAVATLPTTLNSIGGQPLTPSAGSVKVNQFTLTASPKVKFMQGSKLRPWIIPVGFAIHVISPPSDGVTVLQPGIHFATGADYNLWENIYVGADIRYNLTFGTLGGVNVSGFTTGVYAGFGF